MPRAPLHPANSLGTMPKGDRDWSPFAKAAVGVCHSLRTEAPPKKKMRTNGFGREEAVVLNSGEQLAAARARLQLTVTRRALLLKLLLLRRQQQQRKRPGSSPPKP
uniref:Uncharacterized protein n=1 Tax=Tetraselmis chuii TaxID=63592 RepID=A0A7S1STG2_9CHLO|mmetsp:Transcript_2842/g.5070  ORF Transcript_2842/g.5070 Transcript_2842/m.5070 type:complete len:106 (+) Transcript_2842:187-504(+)